MVRWVKAQLSSHSLPSLTSISLPPDRSFLLSYHRPLPCHSPLSRPDTPISPSWSINMFSEGIKRGLEVIYPLSISIVSLFAGIHHERRRRPISQVSSPSAPKACDDNIAEHRIQHTEGSITKPSMTSCFLESEEDSVSHMYCNTLNQQTFIIVVNVGRSLDMGPQSAWRATVQVDGRVIDRSVKGNKRALPKKVSTMVSEENGKLVKGRLTFAKLVR